MSESSRVEKLMVKLILKEFRSEYRSIARAMVKTGEKLQYIERYLERVRNGEQWAAVDWTDDDYEDKVDIVEFYN